MTEEKHLYVFVTVGLPQVIRLTIKCDIRVTPVSFFQANSYNIEISQSSPGDLRMDCMHMTLLSPVRHHQVLQDYEAPSQG